MDRSRKCILIEPVYEVDALGQRKVKTTVDGQGHVVPVETRTEVFCSVSSVSYSEFYQASQSGINPEYNLRVLREEYSGQKIVEFESVRYSVIRTNINRGETVELTVERKAGV